MIDPNDDLRREAEARANVNRRRAVDNLYGSRGVSPAAAAAGQRAAERLGLPPIMAADPSIIPQAQTSRDADLLDTSPITTQQLANPAFAAVAHDQVEPLSFMERTAAALKFGVNALAWQQRSQILGVGAVARRLPGAAGAGVLRTSAGVVGLTEASDDVLDMLDPILAYERLTGRAGIATQAQTNRRQGSRQFREDITATAGRFNPQTGNFVADAALQGVESVVPSLSGMALAALSGGTAAPVVASAFLAAPQGGTSYAEARDDGRGVGQSLVYGVAQGATEYAGERLLGAGKLVERLALGQPLLRSILRNQLEEQIGEQATTVLQDLNQWATINPDKPFSDYLKARPNAALQTAIATAVGTAVSGGVVGSVTAPLRDGMAQEARATDAQADAKAFEALNAQVAGSELMTRAPDALRGALDQMLDGKTVFVPGEKVVEFFQSNPDLDQWLDEWDIRDQVEQAAAAGTDVAFSQSDYLVRVAPTAAGAAFKPDLRFAIGAMSEREAADRAKAQEDGGTDPVLALLDESIARAQEANDAADPVERVQADVFSKLRAAGTTVDVAREQAAAVAARSQARAERRGDRFPTAWDAYQANPLDVTQAVPERVRANMGRADVFLRALRESRAAPTQRRMLGRSLNEFLSANGGVYDAGGDLASMGLDQWHKGRPGVRKLLADSNGSNGLDYALTRAIEGGYLREDATVDDLTAAMGEELRGRPTYSQGFERDLAGEENAAALNDFEQVLNTMGVDLSKETDAEVKTKLDKLANAVDGGDTLNQSEPTLVGVHNLSEANLLNVEKLGGLPVPSLAVIKGGDEFAGFGDITLIAPTTLIDPKADRANKVFDADVYSPRYPSVQTQINAAAARRVEARIKPGADLIGERVDLDKIEDEGLAGWADSLRQRAILQASFLLERGETITPETYTGTGFAPGTVDTYATSQDLSKRIEAVQSEYDAWLADLTDGLVAGEKIFDGFTNNGNRKYLPHNLDTVVRVLKRKLRDGEGFNYGVGSIRSTVAQQFKSLKAIKAAEGRLIPDTAMQPAKDEADQALESLGEMLRPKLKYDPGRFGYLDNLSEHLKEVAETKRISSLDEYYEGLTDDDRKAVWGFLEKLRNMPTQYFEAKLQRSVDLSEFAGAVVPETIGDKARAALEKAGLKIETYKKGDEAGRSEAIQSFRDVAFFQREGSTGPRGSISFTGNRQIITLMATADKSTFLHESGHAFLQELDDDARFPGASQQLIDDHNAVFQWFETNAEKLAGYATTQAGETITADDVRAWSAKRSMSAETPAESAIYTAAHEQWAETFEQYLMTGKSPSIRLRGSFERFSLWLKAIYNGITRTLPNAVITDDIRGVMDRLLATDEEIATARATMGLAQELEGMRGLMTPEAFSAFADAVQRAADVSRDDLLAQTMKAIRREKTAEWNALAAEIRPDVEAEVDAMPDIAAVRFLRENGQGLSREFVVAMLGNEAGLALLPKGVPPLVRANGLHPDVVAEAAGYPSGVAMLNGLMEMQAEKEAAKARGIDASVRSTRIKDRVRETLLDRYGDILNDGTIAEEALSALHNEKQGEVNQIALTVLGRRVGQSPSPLSVLRAWARRHIGERPIGAARPDRFLQAERKAANAAAQAIAKDDRSEAYRQKQQQQANFVLYAAARQAREDVDKAVSRMMKLGRKKTISSMDQDYLDQIHDILSRYDLSAASAREVQGRIGLAAFVKEREAAGDPIQVPARLLDQASKRHYSTLTVDEIRELDETIQNLAKLGRLKQTLLDGKARRDAQALADEAVATAEANLRDKPRDEGVATEEHWLKKTLQAPANFEASMVRIQSYFERLQGGYEGVFTRVLDVPGQIAYETLTTLRKAFWNPVKAAERAIPDAVKARWFERLDGHPIINPETGQPMTTLIRQDLIGLARHVGSSSNFEKLGKGWGFIPREADEFAVENARQGFIQWLGSELDASEWSYVEAWWEAHDAQREAYFDNERELTGIRPVAVEAAPFEVNGRKFKGGYAPISYDHRFDQAAAKRDLEDAADPFGGINRVARTSNGSAQDRTAYIGPVDFGMKRAALDAHTQMVRIAYGQYVESGVKFLAHKDVQQVIINKLGRRAWSNMNEWLAGQVKDTTIPEIANREAEGFMRSMRSNVAIGSMLFSATTMISQLAGMAQSIAVVGFPTFMKGQALSMSLVARQQDPMAAVKFIIGKSSYMDSRLNEGGLDRDVRAAALAHDDGFRPGMVVQPGVSPLNRAKLALDTAVGGKNNMAVVGGWMIGAMDLIGASGPAWMGVYDNEIAQGVSEDDAVRKADNAVISAQGGSRPIDRAPIMRAKGIVQNFTMFFGWANAMYNIKRGAVLNIRDGKERAHHVAAVGWLLIASPLFDAILGDDWPDDWTDGEELFKWFFRNVLFGLGADIPLVRDVASVKERESQGKYGGEVGGTAVARLYQNGDALLKDLSALMDEDKDVSKRWPAHIINGIGFSAGIPGTTAASRATSYGIDVANDEQNPETIGDWLNGIARGPRDDQK